MVNGEWALRAGDLVLRSACASSAALARDNDKAAIFSRLRVSFH